MSGERNGATASLEAAREGEVPTHVAVIMDGNGRWARRRALPRSEGHRAGMTAVRETIEGAAEAGVSHLTLYAFSHENWSRPPTEVEALMALLEEYVRSQGEALARHGIRVTVFGDRMRLPEPARLAITELETSTAGGAKLDVHLAISYGARAEIAGVARELARRCVRGELSPEEIDAERFAAELLTRDWPDPDLLIRTSGEQRLSNFLLWQLAYAEIFVTAVLWPDFTREHLFGALVDYRRRERRFGLVET
ncbi:polyprenyl diphosphate synthase [Candidatus Palauibacter sp.]|uniref:polyprenyl diphosphate synthase n=1 Tax=Candidatus Palauibacter sp. TaxID=3101350 RepID=UPI003B020476